MVVGEQKPDFEAIVIGAGVTGIYQTHLLEEAGITVCGIEAGADVGGTWFWNRYPGCRLDTESYAYGYFALKGIIPDWDWKERFASQPEMLRYANRAADAMDVRKLYRFNTKVVAAHYQEAANVWAITLDSGETLTCRFLISATGPLSASRMPDIAGIETFAGESFHSSRWPTDDEGNPRDIDFTGKRVGVIGTGATGVQIIPIVAQSAGTLKVFQRSPNWCTPLGNTPITKDEMEVIRKRFPSHISIVPSAGIAVRQIMDVDCGCPGILQRRRHNRCILPGFYQHEHRKPCIIAALWPDQRAACAFAQIIQQHPAEDVLFVAVNMRGNRTVDKPVTVRFISICDQCNALEQLRRHGADIENGRYVMLDIACKPRNPCSHDAMNIAPIPAEQIARNGRFALQQRHSAYACHAAPSKGRIVPDT